MITFVLNFARDNTSTIASLITAVAALVILVFAWFLADKPKRRLSRNVRSAFVLAFGGFVFLYAIIPNFAGVLTVWATLILACVAVFSFDESRRLREENRQREERDRKERLLERYLKELDKISEWAQNLANFEIDKDDKRRSAKESEKHQITGGSIKRRYTGVFSTIIDSEDMLRAFDSINAIMAFLNSQTNDADRYAKAKDIQNELHTSANNILMKADNATSSLLRP